MSRKREETSIRNLQYLKIFLLILAVLIFLSLSRKAIEYVRESSFRGGHFVLLIRSNQLHLVSIDEPESKISAVELSDVNISSLSKEKLSYVLGVPIDAVISVDDGKKFSNFYSEFFSWNTMFEIITNRVKYQLIGMNKLDLFNIYRISFSSSNSSRHISLHSSVQNLSDNEEIYRVLSDSKLKREKTSIEVVNSSGVDGVGKKVAQMLETIGFNVVSITSSQLPLPSQITYRLEKNYTVERLLRIFSFPSYYRNASAIADITIVLGKDYVEKVH